MVTAQELRQAVCNAASREENSTDSAKYWREVLPENWRGPYPPHWCGAFTLWALRTVLGCGWRWEIGKGYLWRLRQTADPDLGDVCYMDRPYQHHAILTAVGNTPEGKRYVISQDGNSGHFPGVCEEHWRHREKWTAFYSIQPLVDAVIARQLPTV